MTQVLNLRRVSDGWEDVSSTVNLCAGAFSQVFPNISTDREPPEVRLFIDTEPHDDAVEVQLYTYPLSGPNPAVFQVIDNNTPRRRVLGWRAQVGPDPKPKTFGTLWTGTSKWVFKNLMGGDRGPDRRLSVFVKAVPVYCETPVMKEGNNG